MKLTTLWKVLSDEMVQIPLFQRDYAQGRRNKETLREKFISRLWEALRCPETRSVKLDFVFGVKDQFAAFQPLDGQQRLTTLWLLHWYVAQRAGKGEESRSVLERFSYETRESSMSFCHALANSVGWDGHGVEAWVRRQKWFFDRYELDPSVRGFVRTLASIEKFVDRDDDFTLFWARLTSDGECPIRFFVRDDMPSVIADDLYIKMNSRGKGLTEFENFKADLLGLETAVDTRLFSIQEAALLDNDWTNLFWAHQHDEEIDEIFFQFFKRYLLAWRIAETGGGGRLAETTVEDVLREDLYIHLHEGRDYLSISPFASVLTVDMKNDLIAFFSAYERFKSLLGNEGVLDRLIAPYWLTETDAIPYTLIPHYGERGNLKVVLETKLLQGLPVLYAACRFFENNQFRLTNEVLENPQQRDLLSAEFSSRLRRWMHFVWNLTEGSFLSTDSDMVSMIRFLRPIADEHTWDLDDYLATVVVAGLRRETSREKAYCAEVQKARLRKFERDHIAANEQCFAWSDWIERAEKTGFLHGEIDFLLPDDCVDAYLAGEDGTIFSNQVQNMERCFTFTGIAEEMKVPLAKALIAGLDHFLGGGGLYDNEYLCRTDRKAWREVILRNPIMAKSVARALSTDAMQELAPVPFVDVQRNAQGFSGEDRLRDDLLTSGILEIPGIVGPETKSSWRLRAYTTMAFYRKSGAGKTWSPRYYFDTPLPTCRGYVCRRREFLLGVNGVEINDEDVIEGLPVCVPEDHWNTRFSFQGRQYRWGEDNWISLLNDEWEPIDGCSFQFTYEMSLQQFLQNLSGLVVEN